MSTYYDQLNIPPSADQAAITAAIDARYNQWRQLAAHPQHGAQAQQQLQLLETIRDTLTDPAKRVIYDRAIGVSGGVGGLADPSKLIEMAQPSPSPTPAPAPPAQRWTCGACGASNAAGARFCSKCGATRQEAPAQAAATPSGTNLWACYKCHADNPPQTKFCFKCGAQLVQSCPECKRETSLIATKMCGNCGYQYDVATKRSQLRSQIAQITQQIEQVQTEKAQELNNAGCSMGCGSLILMAGGYGFGWLFLTAMALSVLSSQNPDQSFSSSSYVLLPYLCGILGAALVGLVLYGFEARRRRKHQRKAEALGAQVGQLEQQISQVQQTLGTTELVRR